MKTFKIGFCVRQTVYIPVKRTCSLLSKTSKIFVIRQLLVKIGWIFHESHDFSHLTFRIPQWHITAFWCRNLNVTWEKSWPSSKVQRIFTNNCRISKILSVFESREYVRCTGTQTVWQKRNPILKVLNSKSKSRNIFENF